MALLAIFTVLGLGLLRALVATKLWDWFVVAHFGLPTVSVWLAYGLFMTAATIWQGIGGQGPEVDTSTKEEKAAAAIEWVVGRLLALVVVLLVGWFVSAQVTP